MAEGVGSGDLRILSLPFIDAVRFLLLVSSNCYLRPARSRPAPRRLRVGVGVWAVVSGPKAWTANSQDHKWNNSSVSGSCLRVMRDWKD